jgi:general stress protein 26
MGDFKNLTDEGSVEKIKELAKDKICLFCTYENNEIVSRPMATQGIDNNGTIWFFSRKDSDKNIQVEQENKVYLMYMDPSSNQYLSLTGTAAIVTDRKKIEELWSPIAKAWFEEGKDDPQLTLIKVMPQEGHYWDTKNGKLVSMIKIAAAALTGKQNNDGGVEGDLKLANTPV